MTAGHSSPAPFRSREINFQAVVLLQMKFPGPGRMVTLSGSTRLGERGDLGAAVSFAVQIKGKRPPRLSLALCSISLLADGLALQNGFSH